MLKRSSKPFDCLPTGCSGSRMRHKVGTLMLFIVGKLFNWDIPAWEIKGPNLGIQSGAAQPCHGCSLEQKWLQKGIWTGERAVLGPNKSTLTHSCIWEVLDLVAVVAASGCSLRLYHLCGGCVPRGDKSKLESCWFDFAEGRGGELVILPTPAWFNMNGTRWR